jgi:N-acetylneuraminate synthase
MSQLKVGNRLVGEGCPVFIIAELGYNFNTSDEALRSVDAAAEAGVDAVKLQTFRAEAGGVNQYEEFKRYEISEEAHKLIFARARKRGLIPFSTPSHFSDVDLLERVGVDVYKVGSDDLTNLPFLRYVAARKKPVIFSSGMATLSEVDEAIRTMQETGSGDLVLLQCVSNYPIKNLGAVNLRVIESYRKAFGIPVGLSDHTTTFSAAVAAVTLGACVIERHFALSKDLPVPDAFFSADPTEMRALVAAVRETERMLGDGIKRPALSEIQMRKDTRKSIVARRPIAAGQTIGPDDLIVKRPGWGISPRDWDRVIGRKAVRSIGAVEVITWDFL